MLKRLINKSAWLSFIPYLLLYVLIVLRYHEDFMYGDEERYYTFAQNLLRGFYSPPAPDINLWNGPGYPLFLVPFVFFKLPLVAITLCNAFFLYLSVVFLYKSIIRYTNKNYALFFSLCWASYFVVFTELQYILTEIFSIFLSTLFLYLYTRASTGKNHKKRYLLASGITLGYLVLTKIIFGYILLILIAFYFIIRIVRKNRTGASTLNILLIAFLINAPYLLYTYNLTGKWFYWGNSGGMSLYWMSTPFEREYGDFYSGALVTSDSIELIYNSSETRDVRQYPVDLKSFVDTDSNFFVINHQADIDYIYHYSGIERDEAYRRLALQHIREKPLKYIRNIFSNISRLFFGYPYSYTLQKDVTVLRLFTGSLVFVLLALSAILSFINFRVIRPEIRFIILFTALYLLLTTLVSAYPRQLYPLLPVLLFWAAYIFSRTIKIQRMDK